MYFSEDRNTGGHLIRKASDRYYQVLQYARLPDLFFEEREERELQYAMSGSKEEDFKRNIAFSLSDLFRHALTKNHCAGGPETFITFRPFLDHHYYILIYKSSKASYERHKIFKLFLPLFLAMR